MKLLLQWGSEIQQFEIQKYWKSRLFEDRISSGLVFNAIALAKAMVTTIRKPDLSKSEPFGPDFK